MSAPASATKSCVYYDGQCPVCSREIDWYRRQEGGDAIAWIDISSGAAAAKLGPGLDLEAALQQMHVRTEDGRLHTGGAAFVALWARLPRTWRWAAFWSHRPLSWLLEVGYCSFLLVRRFWRPPP